MISDIVSDPINQRNYHSSGDFMDKTNEKERYVL